MTEQIGYMRPPKATQFKPGQSGNPKGRPKDSKNLLTILSQLADQPVVFNKGSNNQVKMSRKTAMLTQVLNKAASGDSRATKTIIPYLLVADEKTEHKEQMKKHISQNDQEIIDNYIKGLQNGNTTTNV